MVEERSRGEEKEVAKERNRGLRAGGAELINYHIVFVLQSPHHNPVLSFPTTRQKAAIKKQYVTKERSIKIYEYENDAVCAGSVVIMPVYQSAKAAVWGLNFIDFRLAEM